MKWDDISIDICEYSSLRSFSKISGWSILTILASGFFHRIAIPPDILQGLPDPTKWSTPSASLLGTGCPIDEHFRNHQLVLGVYSRPSHDTHCLMTLLASLEVDTRLCGDWGLLFSLL